MRADVIRYLIMYKIGGVYLDLDYEVLKPFEFGDHKLILPLNRIASEVVLLDIKEGFAEG